MAAPADAGGEGVEGGPDTAPPRWFAVPFLALGAALDRARGQLLPFAPVVLALGIGAYFALPAEPPASLRLALTCLLPPLFGLGLRGPEPARLPLMALALILAGLVLPAWRAERVAALVLGWTYYGPIEGRIVVMDRSAGGAPRLTLDRVVLPGLHPARTPERVRVSFQGAGRNGGMHLDPVPGMRIGVTGSLSPPGPPVEPGGFDFRRHAWFERLGAVGYTRNPAVVLAPPDPGFRLAISRLQKRLSARIRAEIPGEAGEFTASVITGDRFDVAPGTIHALRDSNLAHLLAVSGLHMVLLTGVVYGALRGAFALIPPLALRLSVRRLAALGALAAAVFYLLLSGANVATQRAFIMTAVVLGAVLLDRQAISLRTIAIAALIVLVWTPEALLSAGFQMSFAATVALIAVFAELRRRRYRIPPARRRRRPGWQREIRDGAVASLVSDAATAPFGMAHFNYVALYGVPANLVAVPAMGFLIMPGAVLTLVLWPLGLDWLGYRVMEAGARWTLLVAHWAAGMEDSVRGMVQPPVWVLPVMSLGVLWLMLWPGRARLAGIAALALAGFGWMQAPRPALLVAGDGALVGAMTPEGRTLSRARGAGYAAGNWLEADGDRAPQAQAAARPGWRPVAGGVALEGANLVHLFGRGAARALGQHCRDGVTVILYARHDGPPPGPCRLWDQAALARTGALSLDLDTGETRAAIAAAGHRPWTAPRPPR